MLPQDLEKLDVTVDDRLRLHSFGTDPAVKFNNGVAIYYHHGVRVPDYVIKEPSRITVQDIQKEANTEVRRVMLEKYGYEKYLKNSKARLLGEDPIGKLWQVDIPLDEPLVMVEVLNSTPEPDGSIRTYFLRVPPQMTSPREAIAWTFGLRKEQYFPKQET